MFLDHEAIRAEVTNQLQLTDTFDAAIAFWGRGADETLLRHISGPKIRVICNLFSGGTNPAVIAKLLENGAQVKRRDDLHAKVYLFSDSAIVGSANFSIGGLGIQGKLQDAWIEAGTLLGGEHAKLVREWFKKQWENPLASNVTDDDLKAAKLIWDRRQKQSNYSASILDFDFDRPFAELPLVAWYGHSNWVNSPQVNRQLASLSQAEQEALNWQIDNGLEIEGPGDENILTPGRWVLCWTRSRDGGPSQSGKLWWVCCDQVLPDAFVWKQPDKSIDGEQGARDSVLAAITQAPPPFSEKDPLLKLAISRAIKDHITIATDEYDENVHGYFAMNKRVFKPFWKDVQKHYEALRKR